VSEFGALSGRTPETHFLVGCEVVSIRLVENSLTSAMETCESLGASAFIVDAALSLRCKGHVWAVYRADPAWSVGRGLDIKPLKMFRSESLDPAVMYALAKGVR
jgi:hypothetical protein